MGLNVQFTYDAQGRLATKTTVQMKQTYVFDPNSGNLSSRDYRTAGSQTGLYESFVYDSNNRLNFIARGTATDTVKYFDNGNIYYKKNVGDYTYDPAKIHAVKSIDVKGGTINQTEQSITYNALNLTTQITQGATVYNIKYNPFNERIKTINNTTAVTKYYSGDYEKKTTSGVTKEYHYINSPYGLVAIIIKDQTATNTYYAETDHLGSIIGLLNSNQTYAERLSYDAWGKRRNATDWTYLIIIPPTLTDRGFTGHEHLDSLGLINMNGRIYDPVIGRFLGVDPFVQDAGFSQSYNGYSYCLNNPLIYTDPSGYLLDAATVYDMANSLWNSGGGYWSSSNPDFYFPYYHDYDPNEGHLMEYGLMGRINNLSPGGGPGPVKYNEDRGGYGYWSRDGFQGGSITYTKQFGSFIGNASNISVTERWIGITFPSGQGGQYPIDNPLISSDYGMRNGAMHNGVDFVNQQKSGVDGKPVYSVTGGKVVRLVTSPDGNRAGVRVRIQASSGYQYNYFHLQDGSNSHLHYNMTIIKGDFIGNVGNTGGSRGAHLHFEIWAPNGTKVNPYDLYPALYNIPHL